MPTRFAAGAAAAVLLFFGGRCNCRAAPAAASPPAAVGCRAYGPGFFSIAGPAACLHLGGYVWEEIAATSDAGGRHAQNRNFYRSGGFYSDSLAHIALDAVTPTRLGPLRSRVALQGEWNPRQSRFADGDGTPYLYQGWVSLDHLLAGFTESAWAATQAHPVSNWGSHSWTGLWYGYQQRDLIQLSFGDSKGLFGTISLESPGDGRGSTPDVVAILGEECRFGALWVKAALAHGHAWRGETTAASGLALSLGMQTTVPHVAGSSLRLIAFYASSDNAYGSYGPFWGKDGDWRGRGNARWSLMASYYQRIREHFGASAGAQYFHDFYHALSRETTGLDGYSAELSAVWRPVRDFEVRSELEYDEVESFAGSLSGYLRFTRYF